MSHAVNHPLLDRHLRQLYVALESLEFCDAWLQDLPALADKLVHHRPHGKRAEWLQALDDLPSVIPSDYDLSADTVRVGQAQDLTLEQQQALVSALQTFIPWRKGPYELFGTHINTEWRSDWKWQRVAPHLSDLEGRHILDVGCGSGYHLWRMRAAGAQFVLGIDPSLFFMMQFQCIQRYIAQEPVYFLPLRSEDLPTFKQNEGFDTVFSMGVLYHRRSPLDHLQELKNVLRPGGELVLETLIVEGDERTALLPEDRYAKMRNVWFIPSVAMLELWLQRLGFTNIRTVDVNVTSINEQRSTEWMRFESLKDFLNPGDDNQTFEGYPSPTRATLIANLP